MLLRKSINRERKVELFAFAPGSWVQPIACLFFLNLVVRELFLIRTRTLDLPVHLSGFAAVDAGKLNAIRME